jgi:hypothetical protein
MARKTMKRLMIAVAALALPGTLGFANYATAQDKVVHEDDKVVFKKKTVIDFNDVTLEGDLTKPEGSYILNRRKAKFGSLIKLRENFEPELQKSVDNL